MNRVTIVMPVHNGGTHVKAAVASALAQTFADIDLVILENASTDGTPDWLCTLTDKRVSVRASSRLLTIEENWGRILETERGEFMSILCHDDLLDPSFLETIARLVQDHPEAALYQTHFRLIDGDGAFLRRCRPMAQREDAADFLAARLAGLRDSFGTGYVMRSADYDRIGGIATRGYRRLLFADDALWLSLLREKHAWKATAPEEAFSYRAHATSTTISTDVETFFDSLRHHRDFLCELAAESPALEVPLKRYGPDYFFSYCQGWHVAALRQHLEGKGIYPASLRARLAEFAQLAGGRGSLVADGWSRAAFYEWCDRTGPVGRLLFSAFSWAARLGRANKHGSRSRRARACPS